VTFFLAILRSLALWKERINKGVAEDEEEDIYPKDDVRIILLYYAFNF